ncbi:unnamed protein product [Rhizoctonia solani]|uniref:Jacalin-type lectin domain-containing protein n=1 Tax=Rhizoctonia solani TaxID=456999 RepID=A0A8H3GKZ3_9AGAM|nr:unnamed protein product [Rhizoctonia solani]
MLRHSISFLAVCSFCLTASASVTKQAAGTFNVLTMAIRGSVQFSDDWLDIPIYMKYIGQDFEFHEPFYEHDNHPFRTATSGEFLVGDSGLNTLSKYDWVDFSRVDWYDGYNFWAGVGWYCGFTFMRVRIEEGVYIDMINLQANNGMYFENLAWRGEQIEQLVDFIKVNSVGNAVIVFGNTESRYTRPDDNIRLLTTETGLTDAWVQAIGGSPPAAGASAMKCPEGVPPNINCEVEEKVFYRRSPTINLNSTGFFCDTSRFLSPEGELLTWHNPVRVEFAYTVTTRLRLSKPYGGPHGTWFNDLPSIPASPKLSYITLHGDQRLDSITLALTSGHTFTHGGSGGHLYSLYMTEGEYVKSTKLCWGKKHGHTRIFYAQLSTNWERQVQAGNATTDCATFIPPSEHAVVGTYGRSGSEVDHLGFIYVPLHVPPAIISTMSTRPIPPEPNNAR